MSETWHIPRASLGSISGSSNSAHSSLKHVAENRHDKKVKQGHTNRSFVHQNEGDGGSFSESSHNSKEYDRYSKRRLSTQSTPNTKSDDLKQKFDEYSSSATTLRDRIPITINGSGSKSLDSCINSNDKEIPPKRGSRSSQGSTDSNHSSHSASSGSLLLTVANLENFAKIHRKDTPTATHKNMEEYISSTISSSKYNTNITLHQNQNEDSVQDFDTFRKDNTVIPIDELVEQQKVFKTKDVDSISMASSTHFTVVNGMGGPQRKPTTGMCSRGHQITVLIVTMSFIFMVGISAAVFFLEMRAREMPH